VCIDDVLMADNFYGDEVMKKIGMLILIMPKSASGIIFYECMPVSGFYL